jgi:hypothetical protein
MFRRWFGKQGGRAGASAGVGMTSDHMELPPPMLGASRCSDDECPCDEWDDESQMPPAQGYLYITPEVVEFRADCLSVDELVRKLKMIEDMLGRIVVGGKGALHPMVICEQAARRRSLDLAVASQDFDSWMSRGRVPCRPTPYADSAPPAGGTALGRHDPRSALRVLKEIGIEDGLASQVVDQLAQMSQTEAEARIASLLADGGDPRSDDVLTGYLLLKQG